MNIVTTNTTGVVMPYNIVTTCYYPKYNNYDCAITNGYYGIIEPSDKYRLEAVEEVYKRGYITRDEADNLISERYAKRNDCTTIFCVDEGTEIVIFCTESTSFLVSETLFKFSYDKASGKVIEEIN